MNARDGKGLEEESPKEVPTEPKTATEPIKDSATTDHVEEVYTLSMKRDEEPPKKKGKHQVRIASFLFQ